MRFQNSHRPKFHANVITNLAFFSPKFIKTVRPQRVPRHKEEDLKIHAVLPSCYNNKQ